MRNSFPEVFPAVPTDKRSGSALVLAVLFIGVLVPMIGLAIDGTNVYMMRNQIQNALNAAVLAGNRSLNLAADIGSQTANAQTVAMNTFNANTANMYSGVNMADIVASSFHVTQNANMTITVSATGTATLPLMLMGMIPAITGPTVPFSASASRRSTNIMLVLDHSGPMGFNPAIGTPLDVLKADATDFVNNFAQRNGASNIGLVTYTGAPFVANALPNPYPNYQPNVTANISLMAASGWSMTNTAAAMSAAYGQLRALNQPGALNVIVLFTEGLAGAFTGNFAGLVTSPPPAYCNPGASPLNGLLWSNQLEARFGGLGDITANSINDTPEARGAPACTSDTYVPDQFLSAMPTSDIYGNSTNGTGTASLYTQVDLTSIDANDITAAAENALDDAANRARGDASIPATIFVIGLGGNPAAIPPDPLLMPRIANDPASASYNGNQPAGQYIFAPDTAHLQAAFASIASQVLRLAAR
jgi:Flp pilus assembly protein TadG